MKHPKQPFPGAILLLMLMALPFIVISQNWPSAPLLGTDFEKGVIHIKLKEGIGPYTAQQGGVSFGIPSLDQAAFNYEVDGLRKAFRHQHGIIYP